MTINSYGGKLQLHSAVYETAAWIADGISEYPEFIEINWDDQVILKKAYVSSKITLLHQYIFSVLCVHYRMEYRKNADMYEEDRIQKIEAMFQAYNIVIPSFESFFTKNGYTDESIDDAFYNWFLANEDTFSQLWGKLADEVFHLLFANRLFLLEFNLGLAEYLKSGEVNIPPQYLTSNGRIKRQKNTPKWLKNAVYCRDHGRCVLCQRDLSGLLSTDRQLHFDHIIPLNLWGTNDPVNFQLLCDECNLKKSGNLSTTSPRYSTWWNYDEY